MMKLYILVLSVCCLFSSSLNSQSLQESINEIDSLSRFYFPEGNPGAVVLIGQKGKILFHNAYGSADLELGIPMNKNMVFSIASITKQFTAIAVLKLVQEGKLSLDDHLGKFFDNFPESKKDITIHHLLSHTSGIENLMAKPFWYNDINLWRVDFSVDSLINLTINDSPLFDSGDEFHYGNTNYYFLGKIIELVSGKNYAEFIKENLLENIGLTNTYVGEYQSIIKDRAKGYKNINGNFYHADYMSYTQAYSAGEIRSTTEDLFKWYNAVFDHNIIESDLLKKVIQSVKLNDGRYTGYGYGYFVTPISGVTTYNHGGMMPGYFVNSIYEPKSDLCVIVFSNWEYSPAVKLGFQVASKLINSLHHKELSQNQKEIIGKYESNGNKLTIVSENNSLFIQYENGQKEKIYNWGPSQYFFGEIVPGIIIFEEGNDGSVNRMKIKWYFSSYQNYSKIK